MNRPERRVTALRLACRHEYREHLSRELDITDDLSGSTRPGW